MDDKKLRQLIEQDHTGEPDPAIELRMQRAFMLRSAGYQTRQNSFGGLFAWLFSPRQALIKAAGALIVVSFILIRPSLNTAEHLPAVADSTGIDQPRVQDSVLLQIPRNTGNDSVF